MKESSRHVGGQILEEGVMLKQWYWDGWLMCRFHHCPTHQAQLSTCVRGTPPAPPSASVSCPSSAPAPGSPLDVTLAAPDPPPASATLACHVTRYLTHTDTYLLIAVLFIISITLYISPYPQGILILSSLDPLLGMFMFRLVLHNNLNSFRSPASTAFRFASCLTIVALTVGKDPPRELTSKIQHTP